MDKGYVHVYTGDGKGKTTAALGLSLRALCAGKKVFFAQFIKGMDTSELKIPEMIKGFTILQYGRDCFIEGSPRQEDILLAKKGLQEVSCILRDGEFDLVVLDEINMAIYYGLFQVDEIIDLLKSRHQGVEVVLTGRNADKKIIEYADLVSEIKKVKHYYENGVQAREGIEK